MSLPPGGGRSRLETPGGGTRGEHSLGHRETEAEGTDGQNRCAAAAGRRGARRMERPCIRVSVRVCLCVRRGGAREPAEGEKTPSPKRAVFISALCNYG